MYGHVAKLAEAEKKGIEEAGGSVDVFQCVSSSLTLVQQSLTTILPAEFTRPLVKRS
jgi:NAD(P)H dehydrogenase (quinone)